MNLFFFLFGINVKTLWIFSLSLVLYLLFYQIHFLFIRFDLILFLFQIHFLNKEMLNETGDYRKFFFWRFAFNQISFHILFLICSYSYYFHFFLLLIHSITSLSGRCCFEIFAGGKKRKKELLVRSNSTMITMRSDALLIYNENKWIRKCA